MKFKIVACNLLAEKQPSNSRRQHNAITSAQILHRPSTNISEKTTQFVH